MTPFIAASTHGPDFVAWALLAVMGWLAWYLLACAAYPWRPCTWCDGGKRLSSSGKHWRDCRHCQGTGRRARVGRWIWTVALGRRRSRRR